MTITRKRTVRLLLAALLCIALVFSLTPILPGGQAHAADGDGSSIVFNYEVDGTVQKTWTTGYSSLSGTPTDMTGNKYLAWDGSAYKVYAVSGANDAISIDSYNNTPTGTTLVSLLQTQWSITLTYGTVRFKQADGTVKEYSINDIKRRADFYTDATATAIPDSPTPANTSNGTQAFITLDAKADTVSGTSGATTPTTAVTGLTFCTNLDTRSPSNYGDYATQDERYKALGDMPQNITEITFVNSTSFNVFDQVGDGGSRTIRKSYTDPQLNALARTDKIGFLQYAAGWIVHATDNYVRIQDLISDAGLVFNEGDRLLIRSSDMFSYSPDYATIQSEKYFFGGITPTDVVTVNPTEVGAVIAVGSYGAGSVMTSGTTATELANLTLSSSSNKRFFIGLSAANATAQSAAGSRFPNYVTEVTVIKDKADVIVDSAVAGVNDTYNKTGSAIKPEVTVTLDGVALEENRDYTVSYGANVSDAGAVVITGKGSVSGTVVKTFIIDDGSKKTAEEKVAAQEKAAKEAADAAKAANDKATDLQKKLDTANQKIFKATVPTASKFKVKAGKKQATVTWKKITAATKGYQLQYALNKKFTKSKKTVKIASVKSVKKTVKSLKKGKTYYFRVRGVAKIGSKTVYTKWSAVKKVKVK